MRLLKPALQLGVLLLLAYWLIDWIKEFGRTQWLIERIEAVFAGKIEAIVDIIVFNVVLYALFVLVWWVFIGLLFLIGGKRTGKRDGD